MIGPFGRTDDLVAEHEILFPKELKRGRDVDEPDAVPRGGRLDPLVACADVGAPGFGVPAELAHRMDPAADPRPGFEHEHVGARGFKQRGRVEAGESGADHDDVV